MKQIWNDDRGVHEHPWTLCLNDTHTLCAHCHKIIPEGQYAAGWLDEIKTENRVWCKACIEGFVNNMISYDLVHLIKSLEAWKLYKRKERLESIRSVSMKACKVRKEPTCSSCGKKGHRRDTKKCPNHKMDRFLRDHDGPWSTMN